MKAREENGQIKIYGQLPKTWKNHLNFSQASVELQQQEGFYDVVRPEYNTETQRLGEIYFDSNEEVFTYPVIDFTQEELDARRERELDALDSRFDEQAAKRLLRKVAEPILADEKKLSIQDIEDSKMLYKQYRVGVVYDRDSQNPDERFFVWNEKLYKVIGAKHTSQVDWTPDTAVSLYVEITPPGVIAEWKQPTGAHDTYQSGDKVTWNGKTWISDVDNNSWEPGVYGWSEI